MLQLGPDQRGELMGTRPGVRVGVAAEEEPAGFCIAGPKRAGAIADVTPSGDAPALVVDRTLSPALRADAVVSAKSARTLAPDELEASAW